jgi:hypothetical protein
MFRSCRPLRVIGELTTRSVSARPRVVLGVVGEFSGIAEPAVKSNTMDQENVPWTSLRRGDLIVVGKNMAVAVAGIDIHGAVWDMNGDSWYSHDDEGRVTRLKPLTQFDKHMARQLAFNNSRKIRVVQGEGYAG